MCACVHTHTHVCVCKETEDVKQGPATSAKEFRTVDITSVVGDFEKLRDVF